MSGEPAEGREPTEDEVREAVKALPETLRAELARGPLEDPDDCRICELFDDWIFGYAPGDRWEREEGTGDLVLVEEDPLTPHVFVLVDWHRLYADDGRGPEAFRRCQLVYAIARGEA